MKTVKSCIVSVLLSFLVSFLVIIGIVVAIILGVLFYNWIVTDQTAKIRGEGSLLLWNDVWYGEASSNLAYKKGHLIAKTSNGDYIYKVVGDRERNFVVVTEAGFIGPGGYDILMMREDYRFTTNEVTRVGDSKNSKLCRSVQEILADDSELFFDLSEEAPSMWIAIYYDRNSVGFLKLVKYVQEQYVIVEEVYDASFDSIDNHELVYQCKVIDEKHLPVLRKHLGGVLDAAVADAKEHEEKPSSP